MFGHGRVYVDALVAIVVCHLFNHNLTILFDGNDEAPPALQDHRILAGALASQRVNSQ
jgi:hypothetical protein